MKLESVAESINLHPFSRDAGTPGPFWVEKLSSRKACKMKGVSIIICHYAFSPGFALISFFLSLIAVNHVAATVLLALEIPSQQSPNDVLTTT